MTKLNLPTTGVHIALKTGHTLECELWEDEFEMFRQMWSSTDANESQVITLPSVAGDDMMFDTSNIAMVHRFPADDLGVQVVEDVYDDFDDY